MTKPKWMERVEHTACMIQIRNENTILFGKPAGQSL
jgi:hypothetical protein